MSVHPITRIAALAALAGLQLTFIGAARAATLADCSVPKTRAEVRAELSAAQHSAAWKYLNSDGSYPYPADMTQPVPSADSTCAPRAQSVQPSSSSLHAAVSTDSLTGLSDGSELNSNG